MQIAKRVTQKLEIVRDEDFHYYNKYKKEEVVQKLVNINRVLKEKILENNRLRELANKAPVDTMSYLVCDTCGCHPNVIYTTSFGRFCQQHARFI